MTGGRHFKTDGSSANPSETAQFMAAARGVAPVPPRPRPEGRQGAEGPARAVSSHSHAAASRTATGPRAASGPRIAAPAPVRPANRNGSAGGAAHAYRSASPRCTPDTSVRQSRRRKRNILPILLIVVGIALLLTAGGLFIKAQLGYSQAKESYGKLEQYAVVDDSGDGIPTVDFDALAQINPDIVGWIYAPGTVINYPVVQTGDNTTYLTRMFDGQNNGNGAIFMDMDDTAPGVVDEQTTLYGHHMYDASMFNVIDKSLDQGTFDTFKSVYYITRDATYEFKPLFTAQVEDSYAEARQPNFTGDTTLTQYLQSALKQASAKASDADARVSDAKQVLTLVTCEGGIVPTSKRAMMVCSLEQTVARQ